MNTLCVDLCTAGLWLAHCCYVLSLVTQLYCNYKHKTGRGMSDGMLCAVFICVIAFLYFALLSNLPIVYKISAPLQTAAVIGLMLQRLIYDKTPGVRFYWGIYSTLFAAAVFLIPLAYLYQAPFGYWAGWVMFLFSCIFQVPQVVKIFREKSVKNFSVFFACFSLGASGLELVIALILGLPTQTLFSALRGVLIGTVWLIQFALYK